MVFHSVGGRHVELLAVVHEKKNVHGFKEKLDKDSVDRQTLGKSYT